MLDFAPGQTYRRDKDDAQVIIDLVKSGQVYFRAWSPGEETGRMLRKPAGDFAASLDHEGLVLAEDAPRKGGEQAETET